MKNMKYAKHETVVSFLLFHSGRLLSNGSTGYQLKYYLRKERYHEEYYLLGCDDMHSGRCSLMFQRKVLLPSSWLKSKPSKQGSKILLLYLLRA
jgi:hypothetical protein